MAPAQSSKKQYRSKKQYNKKLKMKSKLKYKKNVWQFKSPAPEIRLESNIDGTLVNSQGEGAAQLSLGNFNKSGTGSNTAEFTGVFNFSAGASQLFASRLATMFDRYKVNGVKVHFTPLTNAVSTAGTGSCLPTMKLVFDYDDNKQESIARLMSRQGKIYRLDKPFSVFLKPKIASNVANGQGVISCPYLNSASGAVNLFGLKMYIRDWYLPTTGWNNAMRITVTYYFSCKDIIAGYLTSGEDVAEDEQTADNLVIAGPTGATGPKGDKGDIGDTGATGPTGPAFEP